MQDWFSSTDSELSSKSSVIVGCKVEEQAAWLRSKHEDMSGMRERVKAVQAIQEEFLDMGNPKLMTTLKVCHTYDVRRRVFGESLYIVKTVNIWTRGEGFQKFDYADVTCAWTPLGVREGGGVAVVEDGVAAAEAAGQGGGTPF